MWEVVVTLGLLGLNLLLISLVTFHHPDPQAPVHPDETKPESEAVPGAAQEPKASYGADD